MSLLTTLVLLASSVQTCTAAVDYKKFCIKYFGSILADVYVANSVPERNYNGTLPCPRSWKLPEIVGATLNFCPYPDSVDNPNGAVMDIELSFRGKKGFQPFRAIDAFLFNNFLVRNDLSRRPIANDGAAAGIAYNTNTSTSGVPMWIISGTQASLTQYPTTESSKAGGYFSCADAGGTKYCGVAQDDVDGGCWSSQIFKWNMKNPLNYNVTFDGQRATFVITAEDEWKPNGRSTDTSTKADILFSGGRLLPGRNLGYWGNSETTFDEEFEAYTQFHWEVGDRNYPVFVNRQLSREWYSTSNGTFSTNAPAGPNTPNFTSTESISVLLWILTVSTALWLI
jgi:hypothetical protein